MVELGSHQHCLLDFNFFIVLLVPFYCLETNTIIWNPCSKFLYAQLFTNKFNLNSSWTRVLFFSGVTKLRSHLHFFSLSLTHTLTHTHTQMGPICTFRIICSAIQHFFLRGGGIEISFKVLLLPSFKVYFWECFK